MGFIVIIALLAILALITVLATLPILTLINVLATLLILATLAILATLTVVTAIALLNFTLFILGISIVVALTEIIVAVTVYIDKGSVYLLNWLLFLFLVTSTVDELIFRGIGWFNSTRPAMSMPLYQLLVLRAAYLFAKYQDLGYWNIPV